MGRLISLSQGVGEGKDAGISTRSSEGVVVGLGDTFWNSTFLIPLPYRDDHDKKSSGVPDTKKVAEGSASRNIQRKHDHDPNRYVPGDKAWSVDDCYPTRIFELCLSELL
jgi:hypothetical protein